MREKSEMPQVASVFQELNKAIEEMDVKIGQVIRSHEAQFMFAYRNHIQKMRTELAALKGRVDSQERQFQENGDAMLQEKQIKLFREEALKLYNRLTETTQQTHFFRQKLKEIQKHYAITDKQNKFLIKQLKMLQITSARKDERIAQLQKILSNCNDTIQVSNKKSLPNTTIFSQLCSLPQKPKKLITKLKEIKQPISISKQQKKNDLNSASELQNWFLQCLKTIKKQVFSRKNYASNKINFKEIHNFQEFKMLDKLKLLQMFMSNQKILVWLYSRIFPDRLSEISNFLSFDNFSQKQNDLPQRSIKANDRIRIRSGKLTLIG